MASFSTITAFARNENYRLEIAELKTRKELGDTNTKKEETKLQNHLENATLCILREQKQLKFKFKQFSCPLRC